MNPRQLSETLSLNPVGWRGSSVAKCLAGVHESLGPAPNTEGRAIKSQAFWRARRGSRPWSGLPKTIVSWAVYSHLLFLSSISITGFQLFRDGEVSS